MKKALVLVACLGFVAAAGATQINLSWSVVPSGDPFGANLYSGALTDFKPYYSPMMGNTDLYTGDGPDPTSVTSLVAGSYDLFLWGDSPYLPEWHVRSTAPTHYTDNKFQIYGLDLKWDATSTATVGDNVVYREDDGAGTARWQGDQPIPLDGVMAAVNSAGIALDAGWGKFGTQWFHTEMSWLEQFSGKYLLGAAHVTGTAGQVLSMSLDTAVTGGKGIACRLDGDEIPDPDVMPAVLTFTPEPLSFVLLLAGLALRRR